VADPTLEGIQTERQLAGMAAALGALSVPITSDAEAALVAASDAPSDALVRRVRVAIRAGQDVLGAAFCRLRDAFERRPMGATYTPQPIVDSMVAWSKLNANPVQVVDAGTGSGRFLVASGKAFRRAELQGVELDPLAALCARANLAVAGFTERAMVYVEDYRSVRLPDFDGQRLFIGNPPYVRHHLITPEQKQWLTNEAEAKGYGVSQLAGLHVHFFLATLLHARAGDRIAFITASEWLDVNYGKLVRDLFLRGLGGKSLFLIEPTAVPFQDAATTAVITCHEVGATPASIRVKRIDKVASLGVLAGGRPIRRERLESAARWTPLTRPTKKVPEGFVELGELCSVHRGQVTGSNRVWIAGEHAEGLPDSVLLASVTKARELIAAGVTLDDASSLRRVIDIPVDLDVFSGSERAAVDAFLKRAKKMGADRGFIAEHRKAWWSVGLRKPAPILSTYMARRSPAFVVNAAEARHINIAHGIYPRDPMSPTALATLARVLTSGTTVNEGRTYAGGLTKFEPKEMERLLVPDRATLEAAE
jgi:adenine-specific DNA-methyltransferase